MNIENLELKANGFNYEPIGWKHYNKISKKAMEKISASGLVVSLFIAFFMVIFAASLLGVVYNSVEKAQYTEKAMKDNIYRLESMDGYSSDKYLQIEEISREKLEKIREIQLI